MKKLIVGFVVFFVWLLAQNVYANTYYLEMYTEPPDVKYKVINEITHESAIADWESVTVDMIGKTLQSEASKLGANALIIRKMERIVKVQTKKENYDIDPFGVINWLIPFIRIEATAIKIEKAK